MHVVLEAIVGSKAYGLDTPTSDTDIKGVYVAPLKDVLGIDGPVVVTQTKDHTDPDWAYHEVGKFVNLVLKCNPTALEMLYVNSYNVLAEEVRPLIDSRYHFLSEPLVRSAYGGYARAQVNRLMRAGRDDIDSPRRTEKNGRHTIRLLLQGIELLRSNELTVDLSDKRDYLFSVGLLARCDRDAFYAEYLTLATELDNIETTLPNYPNRKKANDLLVDIRLAFQDYREEGISGS